MLSQISFVYTNKNFLSSPCMNTSDSRFSQCLYFSSNAFARKIEKLALESWKPVGLSPSHGYLLMHVIEDPGIQPGVLAQHLQLQPSTVTRLIEKLEDKKLLVRTTEGKTTNVHPTSRAKEMHGKMQACIARFSTAHTALLGKEEGKKMVQQLNKLADRFSD
ncbi:MAG: MarR family transcriptional regulator [Chitinophagaceae bacterium]|nr:MAG: MarR family transcriptional regulator [Chitinophagaceae bacterium]